MSKDVELHFLLPQKQRQRALDLLEKISRKHDTAMRSQLRYTWRPGTETGKRDLARSQAADEAVHDMLFELACMLDPARAKGSDG